MCNSDLIATYTRAGGMEGEEYPANDDARDKDMDYMDTKWKDGLQLSVHRGWVDVS